MTTPAHLLTADAVTVSDRRRPLLAPTSLALASGELLVVHGDPGHGHTVLALALAGRLIPDGGRVALDGRTEPRLLQEAVALVDVPGVSEPDGNIPVTSIVGEELAMARRPAGRRQAMAWLEEHDLTEYAGARVEDLPTTARVRVLAGIAATRAGVRFLVLTLPERTGGLPDHWIGVARSLVHEELGVLVTTSTGVAQHLAGVLTVAFGETS